MVEGEFVRQKGDPRVHSSILGEGGRGVSPESRIQSLESRVQGPGFTTAFRMCRPNCDRKMLESCLLGCQKVAKKLPKIQKVDKLLRKVCIFLFSI